MSLANLIRGKSASDTFATAIPAIFATQPEGEVATVAKIATVASPKEEKTAPRAKVGAGGGDTMTLSALIRKRGTWKPGGEVATVAKIATVAVANPQEAVPDGATVAKIATVAVANPPEALTASRWWRLHYPDREPVEVASFPPATHADILERHSDAIAAEPFDLVTPEATLDGELERRILAMAERWGYSSDDLALALGAAGSDPDGWRRLVDSDERGP